MAEALIVVDFQNDFTPGGALAVADGDEIAERVNELAADPRFELVIATRDWHPPDHGSFAEQGGPWPPHCVQDTEGAELHPRSTARESTSCSTRARTPAPRYSGFEGTRLEELLRERNVDKVTIVGLATDYCVKNTAPGRTAGRLRGDGRSGGRARGGGRGGRLRARPRRDARGRRRGLGVSDANWERMLASMRVFFRPVGEATDGYRTIERDGVLASVTPAVPDRSLPNSVVYENEDALAGMLDELAGVYDEAGVRAWTVWTPQHHERTRELLSREGHVLDADPAAMILELAEAEPPRPDDPSGRPGASGRRRVGQPPPPPDGVGSGGGD